MRSPHRRFAARTQNPRKKIIKEFENPPARLLQIAEDERIPGISLRLATLPEHWICVSFFDIEVLDSMEGAKSVGLVAEVATTTEKRSRFRRICVFCGSQCGKKPSYQEAAIELGKELVTMCFLNQVAYFREQSLFSFLFPWIQKAAALFCRISLIFQCGLHRKQ